jgi:apolipoprotein N-acyltransferase
MADNINVPLVVDLDGTIIRTDLMWESLAQLLRRNPFAFFQILFWWTGGRAHLKQKLAARVQVDPATLPYHEQFLIWLRREKSSGRKIILATASDLEMARPVANHLGLFDEILASDGKTNLRRENKSLALVNKFGERGFDYAGNSMDDLAVWRSARLAIVVNAPKRVQQLAAGCAKSGPSFCEGYSALAIPKSFVIEFFWRSGYLAAAGAGLLLATAFPKFSIAGFAWIAPALILAAAYGKSGGDSFRAGYVSALFFWLASLYWLLLMPAPVYSVILGWLALSAFVGLYFGAWVWLLRMNASQPSSHPSALSESWTGRALWALGGAAAWVALEMVRARLLGGFPWSFLGVSQFQLVPLIQIASVTGVYGVSFLVVWFSLALYSAAVMTLRQPSNRQVWHGEILLPMLAVLACYLGGFFAVNGSAPAQDFLRVTTIQPSVPQTLIWSASDDARRFKALLDLSHQAITNQGEPGDLLVWPESAVPDLDDLSFESINQFVRSNHVWLILNGEDVEFRPTATNYFNTAFLVGPDGRWRQAYHKRDLVIFGEYVPLAAWLPFLKWLTPITGGWTAGDKAATFELERRPPTLHVVEIQSPTAASETRASAIVRCAPLICFEDTFPGTARDSAQDDDDFLVNLTNDGWFGESAEQWQHAANAVFRAVENGLPLLRSANNGITCLIDRHGQMQKVFRDAQNSEYGRGAFTVDVPLRTAAEKSVHTFYNRHGDWFGWSCVVATALMLCRRFLLVNRKS